MKTLLRQMMIGLALSCAISCAMNGVYACDQASAAEAQAALHDLATWHEDGGTVMVTWGAAWDETTPARRQRLIETFADADARMTGRARPIRFYRQGKLVGSASSTWGVYLAE
jgi:hypothetical protein